MAAGAARLQIQVLGAAAIAHVSVSYALASYEIHPSALV
jgi:hypothetical protein